MSVQRNLGVEALLEATAILQPLLLSLKREHHRRRQHEILMTKLCSFILYKNRMTEITTIRRLICRRSALDLHSTTS